MQYTSVQYEHAKQVNLVAYLKSKGYEFIKEGYRYRNKTHDSLIISEDNKWYWNSKGIFGAGAISFLHKIDGMSIPEAVNELLLQKNIEPIKLKASVIKDTKPFILPKRSDNYQRAFAYLHKTRGIDTEIISHLIREKKIYESLPYYNVVLLGFDKNGEPKHASQYGTYTRAKPYKGEVFGSDKTYGFHIQGSSNTVFVYESPIDAMSHASIYKMHYRDWQQDHRLSLCGTWDGALERFLNYHKIRNIVFCLDNDKAGNTASDKYMTKYFDLGYEVKRLKPIFKDFNDDLMDLKILHQLEPQGAEV